MRSLCAAGIALSAVVASGVSTSGGVSPASFERIEEQTATPAAVKAAPSPDDLDRMLAPIALYPDALLARSCCALPSRPRSPR